MRPQRMVPLDTLPPFQARLLAARLGAEGILWQLRGESSIYPFSAVDVLVEESQLEPAREMLDVPELEESPVDESGEPAVQASSHRRRPSWRGSRQLVLWLTLLMMIVGLLLRVAHVG
jgi:hypothetical protein